METTSSVLTCTNEHTETHFLSVGKEVDSMSVFKDEAFGFTVHPLHEPVSVNERIRSGGKKHPSSPAKV